MSEFKGYSFNHIGDNCSDDDCLVIESGVSCFIDEFVVMYIYKQKDQKCLTIYDGQQFEIDDLQIRCARCGASAECERR